MILAILPNVWLYLLYKLQNEVFSDTNNQIPNVNKLINDLLNYNYWRNKENIA